MHRMKNYANTMYDDGMVRDEKKIFQNFLKLSEKILILSFIF